MLFISDLHLTDRKDDSYRFDLFPFLEKQIEKYQVKELFILGDVTDFKDKHSSILVNNITNAIVRLSSACAVHILAGNHDYSVEGKPFLEFLNHLPNVHFYIEPAKVGRYWFLPACSCPEKTWEKLPLEVNDYDYLFFHDAVIGSKASDFYEMEHGLSPDYFKTRIPKEVRVLAGDIHIAQKVGVVEYIGSPYRIRLGDSFDPRVLLLRDGKDIDLKPNLLSKSTAVITDIDDLDALETKPGDQIKVRFKIDKATLPHWSDIKTEISDRCLKLGLDLKATELQVTKRRKTLKKGNKTIDLKGSDKQLVNSHCELENLDGMTKDIGLELIV